MWNRRWYLIVAVMVMQLAASPSWAGSRHADLFAGYGQEGTWMVKQHDAEERIEHGQALVDESVVPASTFKVFVALLALHTGALRDPDEMVPWDGRDYPRNPQWQSAMALAEAMRTSNESYFRVLAARIGRDALLAGLKRVQYGNQQLGDDLALAWHDGVFAVSARQQLEFIDRLRRAELPFAAEHQAMVRDAMLETTVGGMRIHGKTGTQWDSATQSGLAWWIGWVEADSEVAKASERDATAGSFVLQMRLSRMDQRDQRIAFGQRLLQASGMLAP